MITITVASHAQKSDRGVPATDGVSVLDAGREAGIDALIAFCGWLQFLRRKLRAKVSPAGAHRQFRAWQSVRTMSSVAWID